MRKMILQVGFIFTNYNNTQYTETIIKSIRETDASGSPIIIVDNASKSVHVNRLVSFCESYEEVVLIKNEENIGYFSGLNTGIRFGRKHFSSVKYWVVGNNDLTFPENLKAQMLNVKDVLERYPVISPNIFTLDGIPQNPHVISAISKIRELIYDIYHLNYYMALAIQKVASITKRFTDRSDEQHHETAMEIYQGYGACYILTPMFFENFEELWSPTFLMYEEYFLSLQLERRGFKTYYEPSIKVLHHWHATTATLPKKLYWGLSRDAHKEYRKYVKFWR